MSNLKMETLEISDNWQERYNASQREVERLEKENKNLLYDNQSLWRDYESRNADYWALRRVL